MEKSITVAQGIRKRPDGSFIVTKSIKGKRHYKLVKTLAEAKRWKNHFRPIVGNPERIQVEAPAEKPKINGRDLNKTFGNVWKKYQSEHLNTLSGETQYRIGLRVSKFTQSLTDVRMCDINPDTIEAVINERKILTSSKLRCNFKEEIKRLNAVFKWYIENIDPFYESPIREYHKRISKIKNPEKQEKHIKPQEVVKLIENLSGIYKSLAFMQFYMAGRVQEPCGLQMDYIDLVKRKIRVECVMTWVKGHPAPKYSTKTDVVSFVHINDHMMQIIRELDSKRPPKCPYLFQINGEPLRYNLINKEYNRASRIAKLPYTGTHILRYGMAGLSGELLGDEGAKAATRHDSMAMARKYRGKVKINELTEENKQVVIHAESLFRGEKSATKLRLDDVSYGNDK